MTPLDRASLELLIDRYLAGAASEDEVQRLSHLLATDPSAASEYARQAHLHATLASSETVFENRADRPRPANEPRPALSAGSVTRSPRAFGRAAALLFIGLVLGAGTASAAWAFAVAGSGVFELPLVADNFDLRSEKIGAGFPRQFDQWSGDPASVVEITEKGQRYGLLQFERAAADDADPSGRAYSCDVFRLVDLRPYSNGRSQESPVLTLTATFYAGEDSAPHRFLARLFVFTGDADAVMSRWPAPISEMAAYSSGSVELPNTGGFFRPVNAQVVVPPGATFAVVQLTVQAREAAKLAHPQFPSQYVDAVRLSLIQPGR